jgi:putative Mg2+ transporter-C (MgtC) family protein
MSVWQQIWTTLQAEFADLPDAAGVTRVTFRLLLAALCGGVLGYEREHRGKAAGLRTHILVALGAAMFVLVPQQAGASDSDLSRVLQGLVAGIGFLGVGAIVKGRDESHISGLTTAAGIWMTAAIGMTAGLGRDGTALLATFLAWLTLAALPHVAGVGGPIAPGAGDYDGRSLRNGEGRREATRSSENASQPSDHV